MSFVGRQKELEALRFFLQKKTASLLVIRGRRRIGKSRLIEYFAENAGIEYFSFSGIPPIKTTTAQSQRDEFAFQLGQVIGIQGIRANDWNTLFLLLAKHLQNKRAIVLLDEISWMGSKDPDFLGKLKNAWDLYFKKNDRLIIILCGSASSWIEKNILSSTGFVGRISFTLTLEELPLIDCRKFWGEFEKNISAFEKLKILSITGGVPKYLEELNPSISAEENIKRLCFVKGGFLVNEFDQIFSNLFLHHSQMYQKVIAALISGAKELSEICSIAKIAQSVRVTKCLEELALAGFIQRDHTWNLTTGKDSKLSKYRLSDNYLRFYLRYIKLNWTKIQRNSFAFKSLTALPEWPAVLGLQFENLVLKNRTLIHQALGISSDEIICENPFFQHQTLDQPGCQIDYLIQTKFMCLYVCEIKFSKNTIPKEIITEVQQKIDRLKKPKGFSCRPVLIHVNGVHLDILEREFFANIIDFGRFLEDGGVKA